MITFTGDAESFCLKQHFVVPETIICRKYQDYLYF